MKPSKRRLKALLHAENVARELRYQLTQPPAQVDLGECVSHLIRWMNCMGKKKYDRPAADGRRSMRVKFDQP